MSVFLRAGLALAILGAAGAAHAQSSLQIGGEAPLVCKAGLEPSADAGALGQVSATCNDPDGYELWVDYPTDLAGQTLLVDGAARFLDDSGTLRVTRASHPGSEAHDLALDGPAPAQPVSLTVRLIPIQATSVALSGY